MLSPRIIVCLAFATGTFSASRSAAAPGDFSDNRPLKIIQTSPANYPDQLANAGITEGEVRAVIHIDAGGKLADCLITAYTHPAFARELLSSVREWEYEPAHERGQPLGTRGEFVFTFQARGMVISLARDDAVTMRWRGSFGSQLVSYVAKATELDTPLTAIESVSPRHPGKLIQPVQQTGNVILDFYVDAEGRPRMPVVTRSSHEWFARAALEALSQWKFAPPTRAGQPVVVRVLQEFSFKEDT